MYQIFGIGRALTYFALLCGAVSVVRLVLQPASDARSMMAIVQVLATSVTWTGVVVAAIGQSPLFPWMCRAPLVRGYLPPIDGEWDAVLNSNWPAIQQRTSPATGPASLAPVEAKITIVARLFHVRMNLASSDRYSTSKTLFVRPIRDPDDGSVSLNYLYKNMTNSPKPTDSGFHYGAATLEIEKSDKDIWMDGVYWTNRNWNVGLNTAGTIKLTRDITSKT